MPTSRARGGRPPASVHLSVLVLAGLAAVAGTACESGVSEPEDDSTLAPQEQRQPASVQEGMSSRVVLSQTRRGEPLTNELAVAERAGFECRELTYYDASPPLELHACVRAGDGAEVRLLTGALQFGDLSERVAEARNAGWRCELVIGYDRSSGDASMTLTVPHQAYACVRSLPPSS